MRNPRELPEIEIYVEGGCVIDVIIPKECKVKVIIKDGDVEGEEVYE